MNKLINERTHLTTPKRPKVRCASLLDNIHYTVEVVTWLIEAVHWIHPRLTSKKQTKNISMRQVYHTRLNQIISPTHTKKMQTNKWHTRQGTVEATHGTQNMYQRDMHSHRCDHASCHHGHMWGDRQSGYTQGVITSVVSNRIWNRWNETNETARSISSKFRLITKRMNSKVTWI